VVAQFQALHLLMHREVQVPQVKDTTAVAVINMQVTTVKWVLAAVVVLAVLVEMVLLLLQQTLVMAALAAPALILGVHYL